jgi:superfamily II DNA or RNA helicase
VGYFTSSALITWLSVLPRLIRDEDAVDIQLLISPELSLEDRAALQEAIQPEHRLELLGQIADRMIDRVLTLGVNPGDERTRRELFCWLVATERLVIRFGFPNHIEDAGIFHEKIGVFDFENGAQVAFTGSANETRGGHRRNYESIDVYRSWVTHDLGRVITKTEQFDEAWNRQAHGLEVLDLSEETLNRIRTAAPSRAPHGRQESTRLRLWPHQLQALEAFLAGRRGVLEMATGTGKTRVALAVFNALHAASEVHGAIICTTGTDLLDQWYGEVLDAFRGRQLSVYRHFGEHHELGRFANHPQNSVLIISRTALPQLFAQLEASRRGTLLVVHDEVHGLGSPASRRDLAGHHESFTYRLGLSATPEREYDTDGNRFIENEVGPVLFQFTLEDAIRQGILCEFDYIALSYELTDNDRRRLADVFRQRAARQAAGEPMPEEEVWRRLAAVYKTAEQKPDVFHTFISTNPEALRKSIIFVHDMAFGEHLLESIHSLTASYSTYYADDDRSQLEAFARGERECLITCHRLSQGIDLPALERVVLFSSDRARLETIQRLGRCLRIDPTNPDKRASVIDFVRGESVGDDPTADADRQTWLSSLSQVRREVT